MRAIPFSSSDGCLDPSPAYEMTEWTTIIYTINSSMYKLSVIIDWSKKGSMTYISTGAPGRRAVNLIEAEHGRVAIAKRDKGHAMMGRIGKNAC